MVALTRPRRDLTLTRDAQGPTLLTMDVLSQLRVEYLDRIQHIEDDYRARTLSARNANLEFSRVVRTFVNEYSGLEAPVLALDDLVSRGVHPAPRRRHGAPLLPQHLPSGSGDRSDRRRRSRTNGGALMALANWWLILVAAGVVIIAIVVGVIVGLRSGVTTEAHERARVARAERLRALPTFRTALNRRVLALSGILLLGVVAALSAGVVSARPCRRRPSNPSTPAATSCCASTCRGR